MTGEDIVNEARKHLKTPFRHQGRLSGLALDCAGLVVTVAKNCDIDIIDTQGYGRSPNGALEATIAAQVCVEQVAIADRQPGDILTMRFAKEMQHVAICAGDTVIHSYEAVGMVCEHSLDEMWIKRIVSVYRFKALM
jgi:cell wall-associated NlpC family hydrolase